MKKLINQVESVVSDQVSGLIASSTELSYNPSPLYIFRSCASSLKQVALISGGGSGHEPMHSGLVGRGMLTAACPGEVFTSPTPDQIYACAKQVNTDNGLLFIIKNYTGDVLNFETAIELLGTEGIQVGSVLVDDDISVKDSLFTAGRRGVAATVLIEKLLGAAADQGYNLNQLQSLGQRLNNASRSIGVALSSCTVPAAGKPSFLLADNKVEFGVGIHGEPGIERRPYNNCTSLISAMFQELTDSTPYTRLLRYWSPENCSWLDIEQTTLPFHQGDSFIVLVNGFGATPLSELYIAFNEVQKYCVNARFEIAHSLIGNFVLLWIWQDCPLLCSRLTKNSTAYGSIQSTRRRCAGGADVMTDSIIAIKNQHLICWLQNCHHLFDENHELLTDLDRAIGDADHGLNMSRGFKKVMELSELSTQEDIGALFKTVGMTLLSSVGGASGPLYGTFFIKTAVFFNGKTELTLEELYKGFSAGIQGVVSRGKAEPGDKTLCDVWWPVLHSIDSACKQQLCISETLTLALDAAEKAAKSTITMQAHKGRASYLGQRSIGHQDPGATSSMLMIKALEMVNFS